MEAATKRSIRFRERLKERSIEKKENQSEAKKQKKTSEVKKPNSDGKDAIVKPINAHGREREGERQGRCKGEKKVTSRVLNPKETTGKDEDQSSKGENEENMDTNETLKSAPKPVDSEEHSADAAGNIKPKDSAGKDELKATVQASDEKKSESSNREDDVDTDTSDADEDSGDVVKLVTMTENKYKDENIDTNDDFKCAPKPVDAEADSADVVNVNEKLAKVTKKQFKDEKKKKTSSNIKPKEAAGNLAGNIKPKDAAGKDELNATEKPSDDKKSESSSGGDDVDPDTSDADEDSGDVVKLVTMTENKYKDENMDINDALKCAPKPIDAEEDSADVVNVKEKLAKVTKNQFKDEKKKKTSSNIKAKDVAGKNEVKAIVKPTDRKEDESSSNENNVDMEINAESIFKIVSRIEYKLDGLVCEQVNEKRMFAILLRMPFTLAEDVIQYNLDLEDVHLFLKFAKYFENVGGKSNGKKVCNILHQIATSNLLGSFDWQKNSSNSFQKFENIVRVIHTAASAVCSPYDHSLGGEIIKTALRNARGSRN